MSQIKLKHSGGNSVSIAAPDSNPASDRILKLPSNADGIVLTTTNPKSGNIIQVVQTTKTNTASQSIGDGVDWDLESIFSATITPSSSSSKILISMMISAGNTSASPVIAYLKRKKGSGNAEDVQAPSAFGSRTPATMAIPITNAHHLGSGCIEFLDTPNSDLELKYWITLRHQTGQNTTIYFNRSYIDSNDTSYSRAISSIILKEVAA